MSQEIEEQIKKILFSQERNDNQLGIIQTMANNNNSSLKRRPGTLKEYKLSQKFSHPYSADIIKFLPDNDDKVTMEDIINMGFERLARLDLQKDLNQPPNEEYDKLGSITFYHANKPINISVTQRELIEANLNPEKLHWKSLEQQKAQISSTDIAIATKNKVPHKIMEAVGKMLEKFKEKSNKLAENFKEYMDER